MAGELEVAPLGTTKTLEASGGSTTSNAITQANDASYNIYTDGNGYPHVRFVLGWTMASAPSAEGIIELRYRAKNIDGANHAEPPEAAWGKTIAWFDVNNVGTAQYDEFYAQNVPIEADYYIYNNNLGVSISAGWTLKATPWTYLPGA